MTVDGNSSLPDGTPPVSSAAVSTRWSGTGLIIAGIAFLISSLFPWLASAAAPPPKPLDEVAADFVVRVKQQVKAKLKGQQLAPLPAQRILPWMPWLPAVIVTLGVAGAAGGVAGFVRREDVRTSGSAVAVGAAAIFLQYFILLAAVVIGLAALYFALQLAGML